jgi:hypothetical protein
MRSNRATTKTTNTLYSFYPVKHLQKQSYRKSYVRSSLFSFCLANGMSWKAYSIKRASAWIEGWLVGWIQGSHLLHATGHRFCSNDENSTGMEILRVQLF